MVAKAALFALVAIAFAGSALAYPNYWANEYAPTCNALPMSAKDCHKKPNGLDKTTTIAVYATTSSNRPLTQVCAGKSYNVVVSFPNRRLAYVYLSGGSRVATASVSSKRCPTSFVFAPSNRVQPSNRLTAVGVAPSQGSWGIDVASATGACAPFMLARAKIPIVKC